MNKSAFIKIPGENKGPASVGALPDHGSKLPLQEISMNMQFNSTGTAHAASATATSEILTYFDLEGEIHDAINMALLMDQRVNDLLADGTVSKIDSEEAALTIFLAGQVVEKAKAVLTRWNEVHVSNGGIA